MTKVFINYAKEDVKAARKLYGNLKSIPGVQPWLDEENLLPSMKWLPAIRKAIRESNYFITLLSKVSTTKKGTVQVEKRDALEVAKEFPGDQDFIIPIRLEQCRPSFKELQDTQYVDFFPSWEKGLEKVIKIIQPVTMSNQMDNDSASTRYEYRVGIIDIDGGLVNLDQMARRLNSVQKFFHFTIPSITLEHDAVQPIEDSMNLAVYLLPKTLYEQEDYLNVDLVTCLTKYPLAFEEEEEILYDYFSGPSSVDDRFMFISTYSLYDYTKKANCTFEKGIAYLIVAQLIGYFTDLGFHDETRGCVMDFCENRPDIIKGLKEIKFCNKCDATIENESFKDFVKAILADEMKI
ncbi:MAG: toll/interleukin-1 receptor domain-containing protein [Thermoplasmata archaeon]|nr:MAG: toll/interleukin-1 receptor domain-containing protein [Thermoplasmata archaeon]